VSKIVVEMTGEEARLWRSYQKIAQKQDEVTGGLKKMKGAAQQAGAAAQKTAGHLDRSGRAGRQAFGASALSQVKAFGAGLLGIHTAISGATALFNEMAQARTNAMEVATGGARGGGALVQLAKDPDHLKRLMTETKMFYARGGAGSLEEAMASMFELESAGVNDLAFFDQLYGLTDTAGLAKAGAIIRSGMGEKEAGSFRQILSKGLAAAGPIPGASASQIIEAASRGAKTAGQLGISDEELIAATSVVSQAAESSEKGGTQVASLLRSLARQGFVEQFQGKPLAEMLQTIRAKGMDTPELIKYFGRAEAASAFQSLDPAAYQARLGEVRTAQETDAAGRMIATARTDPLLESARMQRMARAQRELAELHLGTQEMKSEALFDASQRAAVQRGESPLLRAIRAKFERTLQFLTPGFYARATAGELVNDPMAREVYAASPHLHSTSKQREAQAAYRAHRDAILNRLGGALEAIIPARNPTLAAPDQDR